MIRLLYFGDPHIRGANPRNRTDDYKLTLKTKLLEIFALAKLHKVDAIVQPGDTFHSPEVSSGVLLEFADLLSQSPVPIYTTPGNHDLYSYNLDTYGRTSLAVLERLVPQLVVARHPGDPFFLEKDGTVVQLTFTPYSSAMDRDGYGYSHDVGKVAMVPGAPDPYGIHVAHGMLLDHSPPFDMRHTLIQDVKTNADMVLTGHDHTGYGIFRRFDGTIFCNPGSLTRMSASQAEIERPIQAALIEVDQVNGVKYNRPQGEITLIKLESARPGEEVLDRSKIEAEAKRQYAMESFASLVQGANGETALLDVESIIESIAKLQDFEPEVVRLALEKIAKMREGLKE